MNIDQQSLDMLKGAAIAVIGMAIGFFVVNWWYFKKYSRWK